MTDELVLFISAASDLSAEREVLGRAVAEIPVDVRWRIVQSPLLSEPTDLDAVRQADIHLLLLASDIRAPIGHEWLVARRAGRQPLLFLKQEQLQTPAAVDFIRYVAREDTWQPFRNASDLRLQVLPVLADHLLKQAERYGLSEGEAQRLHEWRVKLTGSAEAVDEETRGGAGESSLLLSRSRPALAEGIPLGDEPEDNLS